VCLRRAGPCRRDVGVTDAARSTRTPGARAAGRKGLVARSRRPDVRNPHRAFALKQTISTLTLKGPSGDTTRQVSAHVTFRISRVPRPNRLLPGDIGSGAGARRCMARRF